MGLALLLHQKDETKVRVTPEIFLSCSCNQKVHCMKQRLETL